MILFTIDIFNSFLICIHDDPNVLMACEIYTIVIRVVIRE